MTDDVSAISIHTRHQKTGKGISKISFVYTYFGILPFRYKIHWIYYLPDNEDKHVQKDKYANLSEKKGIFYLKKKE